MKINTLSEGTYVDFGWSWRCINDKCNNTITMLMSQFAPIRCLKCGSPLINTPIRIAERIKRELHERFKM